MTAGLSITCAVSLMKCSTLRTVPLTVSGKPKLVRENTLWPFIYAAWGKSRQDFPAAIGAYHEALKLLSSLSTESDDFANGLNSLAEAKERSGDVVGAERDYREALRIWKILGEREGVAIATAALGGLALTGKRWNDAETLTREALSLAEQVGRKVLVGFYSGRLAQALIRQNRKLEALPYAQRAVDLYSALRSTESDLNWARGILHECES